MFAQKSIGKFLQVIIDEEYRKQQDQKANSFFGDHVQVSRCVIMISVGTVSIIYI